MLHFRNTSDDGVLSAILEWWGVIISPPWLLEFLLWVPQSMRCICISTWSSRWQVQVRVQVLWICTRLQLEYRYKYQVLHLCLWLQAKVCECGHGLWPRLNWPWLWSQCHWSGICGLWHCVSDNLLSRKTILLCCANVMFLYVAVMVVFIACVFQQ